LADRLDFALEETERQNAARDTSHWAGLADMVVGECHPDQRDFADDSARYIVGLVGRGGGKTTGGAARFVKRLLTTPRANCFYLAKNRAHAKKLMWQPLKDLFRKLGFVEGRDVLYNETELVLTLPRSGGSMQLWGADKPVNVEKMRGFSYHEVGIDEAASHADQLLTYLIREVFGPRLLGALFLIGSPGKRLKGVFYEVSRRGSKLSRPWKERDAFPDWKGWSLHRWTLRSAVEATADRPIPALVELLHVQEIEIEAAQLSPENPVRRREYDGEWAADDTANIFRYRIHDDSGQLWNQWDPERVGPMRIAQLPTDANGAPLFTDWIHVVAIDPGFTDPTAINVFATALSDPTRTLYHRLCLERKGMIARTIAHALIGEKLEHATPGPGSVIGAIGEWPNGMCADTSGQLAMQLLTELGDVYGIQIEPAKKGMDYKVGAIEGVNGDFVDGRVKILKDSLLEEQLLDLQWDESKTGAQIERKGQPNHSTDTLIYGRVLMQTFLTAIETPRATVKLDPRAPGYVPPLPPPPPADDDYSTLFQDDYAALLG
jgi:hypothetical protein